MGARIGQVALLVTAMVLATPESAAADDASEAQLNFDLGQELYRQRRYAEAIERFLASNRLVPNANVVFNIAQTYELLRRPAEAYNWFETYQRDFELSDEDRREAEGRQARLLRRVAVVDVVSDPAGATLVLDRADLGSVGTTPRRIATEAGVHRVIASLADHHDAEREVNLTTGEVTSLALELAPREGVLRVRTEPVGAAVRVDEEVIGTTPLETRRAIGAYRIRVELEGWVPQERVVEVGSDEVQDLSFALEREPATVASLVVRGAPEGSVVELRGRRAGAVPMRVDELEPAPHVPLRIVSPGHEPLSLDVALEAGAATRVLVELAPRDTRWDGWRHVGYAGAGGVFIGGLGAGLAARSQRADFFEAPSRSQLDRVQRLNRTADVLMVTGLVAGVAVLLWDLLRPDPPRSAATVEFDR